jgi:streptogramin lyase
MGSLATTSHPYGIAADHNGHIFVSTFTTLEIDKFDSITGAAVNAPLVSGTILNDPIGIALDNAGNLFVANNGGGTVGEFDATTGATINPALVAGLSDPRGIAWDAGSVFVTNGNTIGRYDATTGATINASFITGLDGPQFIAIVPEPASFSLGLLALGGLLLRRGRGRRKVGCK